MRMPGQRKPNINHDALAVYIEKMKKVYQGAIAKKSTKGVMGGSDILELKAHVNCLAQIQQCLEEHHEMVSGQGYDAGESAFNLYTMAKLYKPNGEVILIPRRTNQ